jgi:hypothetical protein
MMKETTKQRPKRVAGEIMADDRGQVFDGRKCFTLRIKPAGGVAYLYIEVLPVGGGGLFAFVL